MVAYGVEWLLSLHCRSSFDCASDLCHCCAVWRTRLMATWELTSTPCALKVWMRESAWCVGCVEGGGGRRNVFLLRNLATGSIVFFVVRKCFPHIVVNHLLAFCQQWEICSLTLSPEDLCRNILNFLPISL